MNVSRRNGMPILVTGGAGFIGSAVCRHLIRSTGALVINVDKLTYAANFEALKVLADHPRYVLERCDICNRAAVDAVFARHQPSAVLHLAAESHVDRSITGSEAFIETNIVGTYRLLEAARHFSSRLSPQQRSAFRFIHVSTDEVHGSLDAAGRFAEEAPYRPNSPYSASKAASDHLARAWHKTYDLPVIVSNCSNNYGPYQFPEKLIPLTIIKAVCGEPIPVYGDGSNVRDWIFVDDHAAGLVNLLERGRVGEKYNFGGDSERSNLAVVEKICEILDRLVPAPYSRRSLITFVADRPGHDFRYAIDASKAKQALAWQPRECFESGLERTVRWYLENRSWWESVRRGVYGGERLGILETAD